MKKSKLELSILITYIVLIIGSSYTMFQSYQQHSSLTDSSLSQLYLEGEMVYRVQEQQMLVLTSFLVLFLTILFIFYRRRHFLKYLKIENENLETLLCDMENSSTEEKLDYFKGLVQKKNSAEIYALMSDMIRELQESKELADDANRTKSLFLANMSHEIRTPLNGIVGFTKFLKSTNLNAEQEDFVQVIRKSSEDLIVIVNDILDISKIESGSVELEEVFFNPMEEFENVIETYSANASKKDIDFSLWIDPSFASLLLKSDPGKIKQVLVNLISNAVKFTKKGGSIDVIIEKVAVKKEQLSVKFTVKDTGIGISKSNQDKVFEAFTQADSSTNRKYGGTGLGLTISSRLVQILGGALTLESKTDEGSSFFFTLEMAQQSIDRGYNFKPMNMAIYASGDVQNKDSDLYLEDYLLSFKDLSIMRFKTFEACMKSQSVFDVLFIHYDKIDREELNKIMEHHRKRQIVLVIKLNKRDKILDISSKFSHILYEPITFSKIEKSLEILEKGDTLNSPQKRKEEGYQFNNLEALVVEDNPINQKMIQHTLKNIGIHSQIAENGEVGLQMRMENSYDVVFMDIQMPVMNGVDATKAILKYEKEHKLKHVPIIAVTANALKGDRERFLAEGMDEYISKPINLKKFIEVLKKFFPTTNLLKNSSKDILLYKETATEGKIIGAILEKLGYSVDVADNIEELKKVMDIHSYKSILLDRVHSDTIHNNLTEKIKLKKIPSLLFVDGNLNVLSSDTEAYTHVSDKVTDFNRIKRTVDDMMGVGEAS
ncbi:MAG TPA: response regulator [Campylobacterales bacterium]|nr:response regulator [Campylobacterales bacterium]HIP41706.1 response regulator [Campylobacterales bacterium]